MRSGARRKGQSDPHMHRSGVNASSNACTNGHESSHGYLVAEHFTKPEILTKYRPLDARSSNAEIRAGSGQRWIWPPAVVDQDTHPGRLQYRGHLDQLVRFHLHVSEHLQIGEVAQQRLRAAETLDAQ